MSERFEGWFADSNLSVVVVVSGNIAWSRNCDGRLIKRPSSTPDLWDPETWSPMEPSEARKFFREASHLLQQ
jgi:hypothetical protein